jgi:hypothetical protein
MRVKEDDAQFEGVCVLEEATGGFLRVGEGSVGCQFHEWILIVSMLSEWHGGANPVIPVWYDVHRPCGAAFLQTRCLHH